MNPLVVIKLVLLHIIFIALGTFLFVLSFSTPLFDFMDVFFYKGIISILCVAFLMGCLLLIVKYFGGSWKNILTIRDVLLNLCILVSLNMLFFTHVPVTADRAVSIFILGTMAQNPEHVFTEQEIEDFFIQRYVKDYAAFQKRFHEQVVTTTVEPKANGYVLTDRGKRLIEFYDIVADCFRIDKKLIHPA